MTMSPSWVHARAADGTEIPLSLSLSQRAEERRGGVDRFCTATHPGTLLVSIDAAFVFVVVRVCSIVSFVFAIAPYPRRPGARPPMVRRWQAAEKEKYLQPFCRLR